MRSVHLLHECECELGEGPVWCSRQGVLRFVDIKGGKLLAYNPRTAVLGSFSVGGAPGFILPTKCSRFVVGSGSGLFWSDGQSLGECILNVRQPDRNRLNDGCVGPDGRIWFGSMDEDVSGETGVIWSLTHSRLRQIDVRAKIVNGPIISVDGKNLFYSDSDAGTIWRIALSKGSDLGERSVLAQISKEDGVPDGLALDAEGCIWVALWDGWAVHRYAPSGEFLERVPIPCARPTKISFGGSDMRTAFVTTARMGISGFDLAGQAGAGGLYAFPVDVPGVPSDLAVI